MPCDYKLYPKDWKQIRAAILKRAGNKCELCGVENGAMIYRTNSGDFWYNVGDDEFYREASDRNPSALRVTDRMECMVLEMQLVKKPTRIVLTISHANHDVSDNSDENLSALCQRCHLRHDAKHHAKNAARTRLAKKAAGSLFQEITP